MLFAEPRNISLCSLFLLTFTFLQFNFLAIYISCNLRFLQFNFLAIYMSCNLRFLQFTFLAIYISCNLHSSYFLIAICFEEIYFLECFKFLIA